MGDEADRIIEAMMFPDYEKLNNSRYKKAILQRLEEERQRAEAAHKRALFYGDYNLVKDQLKTENTKDKQMNNEYHNNLDVITLLQLDAGATLVKVQFFSTGGLGTKEYIYKTTLPLQVNDYVIVQSGLGFGIAKVSETDNVEIEEGVQYKWVIQMLSKEVLNSYKDVDRNLRKKLAMGKAINEAKAFAEASGMALSGQKMLPSIAYDNVVEEEVKPSVSETEAPEAEPLR